ncbi:hypothetical protein [Neisseria bacilliformis]|uniref:hypothetical protein n=1 Tax=Neisseria bacilliformis TaxID=267212 RepID=UPI0012B5ADC2|nr:hypothetical protein [Neisseria bacilliformis]QMT48598.1 hypothetical protein H3L91_05790 [Neisseria bacilliformis]
MPATDKPAENRLPQAGHPSALRQVFSYLVNIRKLNMGKKDRAREKKNPQQRNPASLLRRERTGFVRPYPQGLLTINGCGGFYVIKRHLPR